MNEYIPPIVGAGAGGTNYPIIPTTPSGGYFIYNDDGSIICIMPDESIIYYDSQGNIVGRYP